MTLPGPNRLLPVGLLRRVSLCLSVLCAAVSLCAVCLLLWMNSQDKICRKELNHVVLPILCFYSLDYPVSSFSSLSSLKEASEELGSISYY
eukprot:scaffold471_cov318-Ochromonas_danica.AAC.29